MVRNRFLWLFAATLVAVPMLSLVAGCGSSNFRDHALVPPGFARGTRGAMDGFVFVLARQVRAADGTAIPNATVKVYEVRGKGQPNVLLQTTQTDAEGFYRLSGQPLGKLLQIEAVDPFQLPERKYRRVAGVISFSVAEDRTRNLNPASTLAAAIVGVKGQNEPLSDEQVSDLEAISEARLAQPGAPDITADPEALLQLATEMANAQYGTADVFVYAKAATKVAVFVNSARVGTVDALPSGSTAQTNFIHLTKLARGLVTVRLEAAGYQADEFTLAIEPGQNALATRTLVPVPEPGENSAPVIVDKRAVPDRLPSSGGRVVVQALVYDPDGDAIDVCAVIILPAPMPGADRPAPITVDMTRVGDHLFVGNFDAPANAHQGNDTYSVCIEARDAQHKDAPTKAHFSFQVAGLRS